MTRKRTRGSEGNTKKGRQAMMKEVETERTEKETGMKVKEHEDEWSEIIEKDKWWTKCLS